MGDGSIPKDENLTPAMKQFKAAKLKYPDCIIFFRMGDFYELFYNDAIIVSHELNITLTKRGTKAKIPLAGIPYHALDNYLPKLVKKGYKVAICEQTEDPKLAKGVVKRDVIKIVTPGTLFTDNQLSDNKNTFIMSICYSKGKFGISICDISTGEFKTTCVKENKLLNEITKYDPSEIIIPENFSKDIEYDTYINACPNHYFDYKNCYENLINHFNVQSLQGFGIEELDNCIISCGALIKYLNFTQMSDLSNINTINHYSNEDFMILDKSTIKNLELVSNVKDNSKANTLLETIDKTKTPMGARLLKNWILRPLIDIDKINERYDIIENLIGSSFLIEELNDILKRFNDIERLISKSNYKTANPRDIIALNNSLKLVKMIRDELDRNKFDFMKDNFDFSKFNEIIQLIDNAIIQQPMISIREGNIIKDNFNQELDRLRDICNNGKKYILELEEREREKTGITNLKVSYNKVFGYFIEITNKNKEKVPSSYIRKQTRVNSERYITEELKELESTIISSQEKINVLEYNIFIDLLDKVNFLTKEVQTVSKEISELDCLLCFAVISKENNYVRPKLNDGFNLEIVNGRHPVIEKMTSFVANDCNFNDKVLMKIITGPNMAGKSTYMRQIALINYMAQIGCFVPCDEGNISIVDRIFTRVGAHDDLTHGQSTFMVEMSETANILNNATNKSLIILDEIGRGTSTYDGVSIAYSVAEYIYKNVQAKTLFATHYHALTKLGENDGIKNYSVLVKEKDDEIIFLRKIIENATNKSFGVQVAKLAGLPKEVIVRAKEIQKELESKDNIHKKVGNGQVSSEMQMNLIDM